jgi:hypothetical protein
MCYSTLAMQFAPGMDRRVRILARIPGIAAPANEDISENSDRWTNVRIDRTSLPGQT